MISQPHTNTANADSQVFHFVTITYAYSKSSSIHVAVRLRSQDLGACDIKMYHGTAARASVGSMTARQTRRMLRLFLPVSGDVTNLNDDSDCSRTYSVPTLPALIQVLGSSLQLVTAF